jgi:hypothetical protein
MFPHVPPNSGAGVQYTLPARAYQLPHHKPRHAPEFAHDPKLAWDGVKRTVEDYTLEW